MSNDFPAPLPRSLTMIIALHIGFLIVLGLATLRNPHQLAFLLVIAAVSLVSFAAGLIGWWRHPGAVWVTADGIAMAGIVGHRFVEWVATEPLEVCVRRDWQGKANHLRLAEHRYWSLANAQATPAQILAFVDAANRVRTRRVSLRPALPVQPR